MKLASKKVIEQDGLNYWDLTIPETHNYVLGNGVVVHNCGCGVGFSVERQFVSQMPTVAEDFHKSETVINVHDSKIGWASSLRELIGLLYLGQIPSWDTSRVRKAGEPLKTFGGRASGPAPLENLFNFCVQIFQKAAGRKLSSIECHDIMCKVADVVVSGGVRRSAMISLSNLSDDRMRNAKNGQWWENEGHRALANNSVAHTEKPEIGIFMKEWLTLYESKSGERGIFNRVAAREQAKRTGRRKFENIEFGTNPCVTSNTWIQTSTGAKQVKELLDSSFTALVNGKPYKATNFWSTGVKPIYRLTTKRGYQLELTDNHQIMVRRDFWIHKRSGKVNETFEWIEAKDLKPGDKIVLNNQRNISWEGEGTFDEGWLLGEIVGDGCYNPEKYRSFVHFWGDARYVLAEKSREIIKQLPYKVKSTIPFGMKELPKDTSVAVATVTLDQLCAGLIEPSTKELLPKLESMSSNFIRGFLRGFFDADGSIFQSQSKGKSHGIQIRLAQNSEAKLRAVQRMLLRFGIASTLDISSETEKVPQLMPDGKGGNAIYLCKPGHFLGIGKDNAQIFNEQIGFSEPAKAKRLQEYLDTRVRPAYKERFVDNFKSLKFIGDKEVFDCTVDDVHAFDANGIMAHNCGEVILRPKGFCNLTEVVIREDDDEFDVKRKIRLAVIMGTMQSTLTDFRYLRKEWRKNAEEERLLGVSLTGIMDNPIFSTNGPELCALLDRLKQYAIEVNVEWANKFDINQSVSISVVKPSGTVSQLVDSSSGLHARFAKYLIRRVRADKKDPLGAMLKAQGVPCEPDVTKPDDVDVFSFVMRSPEHSVIRSERNAIQQLEFYLTYKKYWCEHNPSITVHVKENEWLQVGAWVYDHFNELGGVSFLPVSDHIYKQAPYEEITKEEYEKLVGKIPEIDWTKLCDFESYDQTENTKELACSAGGCELI